MAWNKSNKKTRNRNSGNYKSRNYKSREQRKRQELTTLAYNMGLIDQGLKNSGSAITEIYAMGVARASVPPKPPKKPLF